MKFMKVFSNVSKCLKSPKLFKGLLLLFSWISPENETNIS